MLCQLYFVWGGSVNLVVVNLVVHDLHVEGPILQFLYISRAGPLWWSNINGTSIPVVLDGFWLSQLWASGSAFQMAFTLASMSTVCTWSKVEGDQAEQGSDGTGRKMYWDLEGDSFSSSSACQNQNSFQRSDPFNLAHSKEYSLQVWVSGLRGLGPWMQGFLAVHCNSSPTL